MSSNESLSVRVAEEIRAMLARRRVSGRELARRLDVSSPWVSYRLTGNQEIGLDDLERIAAALDVPVTDLLPRGVTGELNRRSVLMPNQPMPVPGYATPTLADPPPMTRLNVHPERRSADPATRRPVRLTTPTADSAS